MLRKQIIQPQVASFRSFEEIDIAALATVFVTSESVEQPVDHIFDGNGGPGGTCWVAGSPGEQTLILAFDAPQMIHHLILEIEERTASRTQELQVAISIDSGLSYREILRQEFNFSPTGTTFERENWKVVTDGVTHLRLFIKPDKGGGPFRATATTLTLV